MSTRQWQRGSCKKKVKVRHGREVVSYQAVHRDASGRRHKASFDTRAKAEAWLRTAIGQVTSGVYTAPKPEILFPAFCRQWLVARKASLQPASIRSYEALFGLNPDSKCKPRRVPSPCQHWLDRRISSLTPSDLVEYFTILATPEGLTQTALSNQRAALSTLFSDAVAGGYMPAHPLKSRLSKLPKAQRRIEQKRNQSPSFEMVTRLLNWLQARDHLCYAFTLALCGCGLRPGEVSGLRARDLDRARGLLKIEQKYDPRAKVMAAPKTDKARRSVQAGVAVLAALDAVLASRYGSAAAAPPDSLIFEQLDVDRLRKRGWHRMLRQAGVQRMSMYSLRHFFASGHLTRGRSIMWVSQQMGHARTTVTLNQYADSITTDRPGDALVEELLQGRAGDVWGTTSVAPGPTGSDQIGLAVPQVPMESDNVRELPKGSDYTGERLPR
jgi:integrase